MFPSSGELNVCSYAPNSLITGPPHSVIGWTFPIRPPQPPQKIAAPKGEPVLGSKFGKWELGEECSFKKGKSCCHQTSAFFPATVFWGQDGCPLNRYWKGKIMAFGGRWVWGERQEHLPASSYPPNLYKWGRFSTGSLNVNHGGVLFLHSSSVSLHFSWSWPQSEWRVFLLNVPRSNFYGRKKNF